MIPQRIVDYLGKHSIPFERMAHRRAVTAQELAATVHVPGRRVAKAVLVMAGDRVWIAVVPATENVDVERVATVLGVRPVRLLAEAEFEGLFPDCEPGAEPPFGGLYGLPVVIDSTLSECERMIVRAGSHEEAIAIAFDDFYLLERDPAVGPIGREPPNAPSLWNDWPEVGALET